MILFRSKRQGHEVTLNSDSGSLLENTERSNLVGMFPEIHASVIAVFR